MIISITGKTELWYEPKENFLFIVGKTGSGHHLYQVGETVLDVFSSVYSPKELMTNVVLIDRNFTSEVSK